MKKKNVKMLAAAMTISSVMSIPAFAEGVVSPDPVTEPSVSEAADLGSVTVKANGDQCLTGKEFTAFEIFSLNHIENAEEDKAFAYSVNPEFDDFFIDTIKLEIGKNDTLDQAAYEYVSALDHDAINLFTKKAFDYAADNNLAGKKGIASADGKTYRIDALKNGFYLVFETKTEENGTLSKGMLDSVVVEIKEGNSGSKNVIITQKADIPKHDKEILHNELDTWGKVGDNAIGDSVDYRIRTTVPDTDGYITYKYIIHDYMEKGLTFKPGSLRIYKDADCTKEVAGGYTLLTEDKVTDEKDDFEVVFDRKTIDDLYEEGVREIFTRYECILNEDAEIAADHNDNTSYLEYSNNPYDEQGGDTADTPKVTVYDFTFVLDAAKINSDSEALKDANFQILKGDTVLSFLKSDSNTYYLKGTIDEADGMTETNTIITAADGKIVVKGLDDAVEYTLRETVAPAGYVTCADIPFMIHADYDENGELKDLSVEGEPLAIKSGKTAVEGNIVDEAQPDLPTTGGPGTWIFYGPAALSAIMGIGFLAAAQKKRKA